MIRKAFNMRIAAFWIAITFAILLLAGALFALSGLYSVAASRGHYAWTGILLEIGMRRSVATHSLFVDPPPLLTDPERVRLGAGHYHGGCAPCHGAPGQRSNPIVDRMLPPPPSLLGVADTWSDKQLFWIVQNGLKYTGMPAWVAPERNDEVWAVVAFLRALSSMTPADYREITNSRQAEKERSGRELARFGGETRAISVCVRCHGAERVPPASSMVPVIAGQSAAYLEQALRQYADGRRQSGIMQPVAAELDDEVVSQLVNYYAELPALQANRSRELQQQQVLRGQEIATLGVPSQGVPPCLACHAGSTPTFPTLAGQHAAYLVNQLRLWQRGLRAMTAHGAIMAPIAKRLSQQQIDDVAVFFDSLGSQAAVQNSSPGAKAAP